MASDATPARAKEDGFSLLEVVVAIAVFSLGALAVMNVLGESTRAAVADERRAIAAIVAENRLAEAMVTTRPPMTGVERGNERALSRSWEWEVRVSVSPEPRILRIDAIVREAGNSQVLAEFSSFRAAS
ncbi:MAG: type II secretion system minor pseudopilin GspI [Hyphomonadaceae bacterium]|nr:type II secretion system minor pseudopilin GspI [Hyphomonadaceae bacterium]